MCISQHISLTIQVPEGSEQEYDIESTYIHEEFDKGRHLSNDLALVKLKGTGIKFTSYVKAVCLPSSQTVYVPGTNCTISGWGSNGAVGAGECTRSVLLSLICIILFILFVSAIGKIFH